MVNASALWLVPGSEHPVFAGFINFFASQFHRFEPFDYRRGYLDWGGKRLATAVRSAVQSIRADVVIYTQFPNSYSYLSPQFIYELGNETIVVGLGFDDEIWFEQSKYFYRACHAVITTDVAGAAWLEQLGVHAHLAAFQQFHEQLPSAAVVEDISVSFVGDITKPGRKHYIERLHSVGIPVETFGRGTKNGLISDSEVVQVFQRSKINLNFTATNPPRWIYKHDPLRARFGQIKGRVLELAELRKFCLCEWTPSLARWFRPEAEVGVFADPKDLVEKVKLYLRDDSLRMRVAAAAHARYKEVLSPSIQFKRIFQEILARGRAASRVSISHGSALFYESMGRSRGVALLHALRRGAFVRAVSEVRSEWARHLGYWRGIVQGLIDALQMHTRRP